eukprot:TRINITY_DN12479_c1_g5_i1.p1 TRINITY_DN12479_c1_g5~~TRINITY_DN12479_c1_g5_i1.p1  ORF type:complete len:603 (+),score=116.09 TRINITY_DN12479_c1_g5_i1:574-2382(+)
MAIGVKSRTAHPKSYHAVGSKVDHSGTSHLTPQQIAARNKRRSQRTSNAVTSLTKGKKPAQRAPLRKQPTRSPAHQMEAKSSVLTSLLGQVESTRQAQQLARQNAQGASNDFVHDPLSPARTSGRSSGALNSSINRPPHRLDNMNPPPSRPMSAMSMRSEEIPALPSIQTNHRPQEVDASAMNVSYQPWPSDGPSQHDQRTNHDRQWENEQRQAKRLQQETLRASLALQIEQKQQQQQQQQQEQQQQQQQIAAHNNPMPVDMQTVAKLEHDWGVLPIREAALTTHDQGNSHQSRQATSDPLSSRVNYGQQSPTRATAQPTSIADVSKQGFLSLAGTEQDAVTMEKERRRQKLLQQQADIRAQIEAKAELKRQQQAEAERLEREEMDRVVREQELLAQRYAKEQAEQRAKEQAKVQQQQAMNDAILASKQAAAAAKAAKQRHHNHTDHDHSSPPSLANHVLQHHAPRPPSNQMTSTATNARRRAVTRSPPGEHHHACANLPSASRELARTPESNDARHTDVTGSRPAPTQCVESATQTDFPTPEAETFKTTVDANVTAACHRLSSMLADLMSGMDIRIQDSSDLIVSNGRRLAAEDMARTLAH